jgi:hypothetical protein
MRNVQLCSSGETSSLQVSRVKIGFADSTQAHRIDRTAILESLRDPMRIPVHAREDGQNCVIFWTGRAHEGQILEVGVEYGIEDGGNEWAWIIHAGCARADWQERYTGEKMSKVTRDKALQMSQAMADQITDDLIEAGSVKLKLDPDTYRKLVDAADTQKLPVSELAAVWIKDKLAIS